MSMHAVLLDKTPIARSSGSSHSLAKPNHDEAKAGEQDR